LSTQLPANMSQSGLYGSRNLNLNVRGNLNNSGQIIAGQGDLNLIVGGSLNNAGTAHNTASISAQNINIISGSGHILNSGAITALNNLNINTSTPTTDLIINNTGGRLEALGSLNPSNGNFEGGVLNIRSAGADIESANAGIWGGILNAPGGI